MHIRAWLNASAILAFVFFVVVGCTGGTTNNNRTAITSGTGTSATTVPSPSPNASPSPSPSPNTSTTFQGTVAGSGGQTGTMSVNIGAQVKDASDRTVVTVTGTCKFVGQAAITLTGTFDTSTGALTLTGGGLTFSGSFSNGVLSGTISGTITGSFACLSTSSGTTSLASTTYCGNYTSSPDVGVFNVTVLSNGTLLGAAQPTNGQGRPVTLSGTVNGSTFSGTSSQGVHFSGTISSTTINGSFTADNGFPGSFTGTTAGCQ